MSMLFPTYVIVCIFELVTGVIIIHDSAVPYNFYVQQFDSLY